MSTCWYSIESTITIEDINEVNEKLSLERDTWKNIYPISFKHDLLNDTYWLERTDTTGKHHALEVQDFAKCKFTNNYEFSCMKRWGMNGDNGDGEAILRPLIELGKFTIVSEYNDESPQGKAQAAILEEQDHNKLKFSTKEERIKAGIKPGIA